MWTPMAVFHMGAGMAAISASLFAIPSTLAGACLLIFAGYGNCLIASYFYNEAKAQAGEG